MKDRKIPVLLLIFNRPKATMMVFDEIKKYRPKQLFVAADGPMKGNGYSKIRCEQARKITEKIDWKCEVKRLYRNKNMGLKASIYEALNWFFNNVEEGIILEDDCVPDMSFFRFCGKMLKKYKNDRRVMHIGGSNFLPSEMQKREGYYFSKYSNVWGWATWRRAWKKMDFSMRNWYKFEKSTKFKLILPNYWEQKYWIIFANALKNGKINSWAYRWLFSIWENEGISISPGVNLVKNVGLTGGGTHVNTNIKILKTKIKAINSDVSPFDSSYSELADEYARKHVYRISPVMVFAQWAYYTFRRV